jgi:hypothetical protein
VNSEEGITSVNNMLTSMVFKLFIKIETAGNVRKGSNTVLCNFGGSKLDN